MSFPTLRREDDGYIIYQDNDDRPFYEEYAHEPLRSARSIRLLRKRSNIDSTSDANGLLLQHFDIEQHILDDVKGGYTALSYVWGAPALTCPLILGSEAGGKVHLTTQNVWEMTQNLEERGLFWIDQVCIDQENRTEVDQQMTLMPEIYTRCQECYIWLGLEDQDTRMAFDLVNRMQAAMPITEVFPFNYSVLFFQTHDSIRRLLHQHYNEDRLPPAGDPGWIALGRVLCKPWFQRVWTFQEAILPQTDSVRILCGQSSLHFRAFERAIMAIGDRADLGKPLRKGRQAMSAVSRIRFRVRKSLPRSLVLLLNATENREYTGAGDRISALLHLQLEESPLRPISVDTSQSAQEIYIDATKKMANSAGSLLICTLAPERRGGLVLNIPSWVPDWTANRSTAEFEFIERTEPRNFCADRGRRLLQIVQDASHVLKAKGQIVSTVEYIIPDEVWEMLPVEGITARLKELVPRLLDALNARSDDIERQNLVRIARTIIVDSFMKRHGFRRFEFTEESVDLNMFRRAFTTLGESPFVTTTGFVDADWIRDFSIQASICNDRRFAIFNKNPNYLGLVPRQTRADDHVAILHGLSIPVILHKLSSGMFQLIGPCFVDGIMYGEATTWNENEAVIFGIV